MVTALNPLDVFPRALSLGRAAAPGTRLRVHGSGSGSSGVHGSGGGFRGGGNVLRVMARNIEMMNPHQELVDTLHSTHQRRPAPADSSPARAGTRRGRRGRGAIDRNGAEEGVEAGAASPGEGNAAGAQDGPRPAPAAASASRPRARRWCRRLPAASGLDADDEGAALLGRGPGHGRAPTPRVSVLDLLAQPGPALAAPPLLLLHLDPPRRAADGRGAARAAPPRPSPPSLLPAPPAPTAAGSPLAPAPSSPSPLPRPGDAKKRTRLRQAEQQKRLKALHKRAQKEQKTVQKLKGVDWDRRITALLPVVDPAAARAAADHSGRKVRPDLIPI